LWVFFGYLSKDEWNTSKLTNNLKGVKDVPPSGWSLIYGLPVHHDHQLLGQSSDTYGDKEKTLWDFTTDEENNIAYSHSTVSDAVVYSTTSSGMIYALNASRGKQIWEKKLGEKSLVAPVVYGGIVIAGSDNGLLALEKDDGHLKWSKTELGLVHSLSVVEDVVIAGTDKGTYAIRCIDGIGKWENSTIVSSYLSAPLENTVFIGFDKKCCAVDVESGITKWVFETNSPITSSVAVYDGTAYVGCWDTYLYALDADDGALKWKYETGWGIDTTPAISDDIVYFGSMDNNFYALDANDGKNLWTFTCQASIHSSPTIYGDNVFFGSDDGRLYALNKITGKPIWSFTPGYRLDGDIYNYITTPILSNPAAYDKSVFIGAKGHIFALDAQTTEAQKIVSEELETSRSTWIFAFLVLLVIILIVFLLYFARKQSK